MTRQAALKEFLGLLWLVRTADLDGITSASNRAFEFLNALCPSSGHKHISVGEWCLLFDLERNAFQSAFADACPNPYSPVQKMRDRLLVSQTSHVVSPSASFPVPAPVEAIPSPGVGPELHEHESVPVLIEAVGHVDNVQVPATAPRRELHLLCVLVESRSSALGFTPRRFAPVATMRRLPPLQDCLGRWSYDASAWQVSANRIYAKCAAGLYLRQTPALPFKEILQRLRRRGQAAASAQVLAANQQHGQAGAVCADAQGLRSVRLGVTA